MKKTSFQTSLTRGKFCFQEERKTNINGTACLVAMNCDSKCHCKFSKFSYCGTPGKKENPQVLNHRMIWFKDHLIPASLP